MITDKTLDEALFEILRTKKALEALRKARKHNEQSQGVERGGRFGFYVVDRHCTKEHAATLRASLDLTRKLADLRKGR